MDLLGFGGHGHRPSAPRWCTAFILDLGGLVVVLGIAVAKARSTGVHRLRKVV